MDENIEKFSCVRKRVRWPLLVSFNLLNVACNNAHVFLKRAIRTRKQKKNYFENYLSNLLALSRSRVTFEIAVFTGTFSAQPRSLFRKASLLLLCRNRSVAATCAQPQLVDPVTGTASSSVHGIKWLARQPCVLLVFIVFDFPNV